MARRGCPQNGIGGGTMGFYRNAARPGRGHRRRSFTGKIKKGLSPGFEGRVQEKDCRRLRRRRRAGRGVHTPARRGRRHERRRTGQAAGEIRQNQDVGHGRDHQIRFRCLGPVRPRDVGRSMDATRSGWPGIGAGQGLLPKAAPAHVCVAVIIKT